jgi:hypothetical protein
VFPVRYELGFHIPEDDILHSHRRESLKSYADIFLQNVGLPTNLEELQSQNIAAA